MRTILALFLAMFFAVPAMAQESFGGRRSGYSRQERKAAQKAVLKLLDEAKEQGEISRGQRGRLGILFRLAPGKACELLEAVAPEVASLDGKDPAAFGSEDVSGDDSEGGLYRLDIDNLEGLLELLIKYLPQIIELIMMMFAA